MYWNFYDTMGECHWTEEAHDGDTLDDLREWWERFMHEEEYSPEISEILLEDFNGTGVEL